MYGTIKGHSLAYAAQEASVQEHTESYYAPTVRERDVMALWIVLSNKSIRQISNATPYELDTFFRRAIQQQFTNKNGTAYQERCNELLSCGVTESLNLWYVINELLHERCVLDLYRSQEDAEARCNPIAKRKIAAQTPKYRYVPVENHVTREDIERIVVECGYEFIVVKRPHQTYFAQRRKTKTTAHCRVYIASQRKMVTMTEDDVRILLVGDNREEVPA